VLKVTCNCARRTKASRKVCGSYVCINSVILAHEVSLAVCVMPASVTAYMCINEIQYNLRNRCDPFSHLEG
jgi:hypothetical protein